MITSIYSLELKEEEEKEKELVEGEERKENKRENNCKQMHISGGREWMEENVKLHYSHKTTLWTLEYYTVQRRDVIIYVSIVYHLRLNDDVPDIHWKK